MHVWEFGTCSALKVLRRYVQHCRCLLCAKGMLKARAWVAALTCCGDVRAQELCDG